MITSLSNKNCQQEFIVIHLLYCHDYYGDGSVIIVASDCSVGDTASSEK